MAPGWLGRTGVLLAVALVLAQLAFAARPAVAASPLVAINQVRLDHFPEVAVYFTATDSTGVPLAGLSPDRLRVSHNGQLVPDVTLSLAQDEPDGLAVALAIDSSGSMQGEPIQHARAAVDELIGQMRPGDRLAILSFGDEVQVLQDFTDDRAVLQATVAGIVPHGDTRLYDAVFEAAAAVSRQPLGRRAVVVITDGEDTRSSLTLDDAIGRARDANTPVYALGFGEVLPDPLNRLTAVTGGAYREAPAPDQLTAGIAKVASLLRTQYVVRYQAPDSHPPETDVEIVLTQDGQEGRDTRRFPAPPMPPLDVRLPEPHDGETVRGVVELRPTLGNATRVDAVEYLLDGTPLHTATEPPYAFSWDTGRTPPGEHELLVRAHVGERDAQQRLRLTVVPPIRLDIRSPAAGQEIRGRVQLTADVDAAAPVTVTWTVDGQEIGHVSQPPFTLDWDSGSTTPGEHTIAAQARDERGNVADARQSVRVAGAAQAASPSPSSSPPLAAGPATPGVTAAPTRQPEATPSVTESGSLSLGRLVESAAARIGILIGLIVLVVLGVATLERRRAARRQPAEQTRSETDGLPVTESTRRLERGGQAAVAGYGAGADGEPGIAPADRDREMTPTVEAPPAEGPTASAASVDAPTASATAVDMPTQFIAPPAGPSRASVRPGQASLIVTLAGGSPQTWWLGTDQLLGRLPGPNGIPVPDPRVSRRHARISWEAGRYVYRDLSPNNPTRINGQPLPGPHVLAPGDRLAVGTTVLVFRR
ncbi:MAG: VWA domain-containing protein [Chloroflexi bacterium]|nr:VWA domain-containing protein [Chloroflexota bacterium]